MQLFCGVVFVSWKLSAYFSFCIQFMHLIYVCIEFTFVAVSLPSCKALSQFTISGTSASTETAPATCGIQGWADLSLEARSSLLLPSWAPSMTSLPSQAPAVLGVLPSRHTHPNPGSMPCSHLSSLGPQYPRACTSCTDGRSLI